MLLLVVVVDDPINGGSKMVDVARYGYGAFLFEPIFVFGFFKELHEEWVVETNNGNYKPLLLGAGFADFDGQTAFGNIPVRLGKTFAAAH